MQRSSQLFGHRDKTVSYRVRAVKLATLDIENRR
jgi:hypothetical protein